MVSHDKKKPQGSLCHPMKSWFLKNDLPVSWNVNPHHRGQKIIPIVIVIAIYFGTSFFWRGLPPFGWVNDFGFGFLTSLSCQFSFCGSCESGHLSLTSKQCTNCCCSSCSTLSSRGLLLRLRPQLVERKSLILLLHTNSVVTKCLEPLFFITSSYIYIYFNISSQDGCQNFESSHWVVFRMTLGPDWGEHAHFKDREMSIFGRVRSYLAKLHFCFDFLQSKGSGVDMWEGC